MVFIVMENLRGFFNSRPPLVVFMICLGSFAISLITFAYIVKVKDIKDPDVTEDWNTFLEKFSHLEFCVCQNSSVNATDGRLSVVDQAPVSVIKDMPSKLSHSLGFHHKESNSNSHLVKRAVAHQGRTPGHQKTWSEAGHSTESESLSGRPSAAPRGKVRTQMANVTVQLRFLVKPNAELYSLSPSLTQFVGSMFSDSLSKEHKGLNKEKISVILSFPLNWTEHECEEKTGSVCTMYSVATCVTFLAPAYLLPSTRKPDQERCPSLSESSMDVSVRTINIGTLSDINSPHWCEQGARLTPEYTLDDSLTVFLSLHDKSMINLHLMRTSYFLFVMVLTLFCYAMVKGRPAKVKTVHVTYDKLNASSQP